MEEDELGPIIRIANERGFETVTEVLDTTCVKHSVRLICAHQ